MKIRSGLSLAAMLAFAAVSQAELYWQKLAEDAVLPAMRGHASATHDGMIYVGGRYSSSAETFYYNGTQWAAGPALPEARRNTQFIVHNGELLCIGGTKSDGYVATTAWKLTDSGWATHSTGFYGTTIPGLAVLGSDLYAIGGYRDYSRSYVQKYDSISGTWGFLADDALPYSYSTGQAIVTFNDRIYVTGMGPETDLVYSYDGTGVSGSKWRLEPSLPAAMVSRSSTVIFNDRIYTIGGTNVFSLGAGETEWVAGPSLPVSVYRGGAVVLNDSIYVIGGSSDGGADETNDVYVLIPEPGTLLLLIPGLGALIGWQRRRGGLRISPAADSAKPLLAPGSQSAKRGESGFLPWLERLDRRLTTPILHFKWTTGLSENERLLRSFEFMETRMRHCGDRISEAVNRTADRFWNLLLR